MEDKVKIKVNIADRVYPMTVGQDEEVIVRDAAKQINRMIKEFENTYDVRDKQDALAMCALQYVSKTLTLEEKEVNEDESIQNKLRTLLQQLEN